MMYLLKSVHLYQPEFSGVKDILLGGTQVLAIDDSIDLPDALPVQVIDCHGLMAAPGLVDSLVHITGGGGEGGFATRTPEMQLSDAISAGVTTLVGVLGTDSITRSLENLLAKARGLDEEGLSVFCHTGSYQVPARTLGDSVEHDIVLVDKFIGVGEVAISDHRSSQPSRQELARLASQARVGGMLSGKAGIVSVHVGDGNDRLKPLLDVVEHSDLPIQQFYPTHINRTADLLRAGKDFALKGGYVDLTASTTPEILAAGEVKCSTALAELLSAGIDASQITISSDGFASLPDFDASGNLRGLKVGRLTSLLDEFRDAVFKDQVPIEVALKVITSSPADILKLKHKGRIRVQADADLILLEQDTLNLDSVFAKGQLFMRDGVMIKKGYFE